MIHNNQLNLSDNLFKLIVNVLLIIQMICPLIIIVLAIDNYKKYPNYPPAKLFFHLVLFLIVAFLIMIVISGVPSGLG